MLRRFLASFLVTIFLSLAVSSSFLLAVYFTLNSESFYREKLSPLVQDFFVDEITKDFEYQKISLSEDEFKSILRKTFSEDEIYNALKSLRKDFSDNFSSEGVTLSLKWLEGKNADLAKNLASAIFLKLEKCKQLENFNFDEGIKCLPAQYSEKDLLLRLQTELDIRFFSRIPSNAQINIQSPVIAGFNWNIKIIENLILFFPGFLILLLLLILLIVGRSWVTVLRWVLTPILIAVILIAIFLAVLNFVFVEVLDGLINSSSAGDFYSMYLINLVHLFFTSLSVNMIIYLLPLGVFILFLLIWLRKNYESQ